MLKIILDESCKGLGVHPLRTVLTALGIAVGVAAMVAMTVVLQGASSVVLDALSGLGAGTFYILPSADAGQKARAPRFTDTDFKAMREVLKDEVEVLSLMVETSDVVLHQGVRAAATVIGTSPDLQKVQQYELGAGRFIDARDVLWRRNTCVVGAKLAEELRFPPDGTFPRVRLRDRDFQVVGMLKPRGQRFGVDMDRVLLIPLETMRTIYFFGEQLSAIGKVRDPGALARISGLVEENLRALHMLPPDAPNDFRVLTQTEIVERLEKLTLMVGLVGGAITGISLLVGGIGIMNICLFSAIERTPEIGVRRALGARRRHILAQFLAESLLISLGGGAFGVAAGALTGWALALQADIPFDLSASAAGVGFLSAVLTGVVFGVYPARRASATSPMTALQHP
ncbi:MAG: ABC transporter permease [Acidobacteriota bacterium]|jgi:putative ABC transport system permease protein|nr:ABC transporter permease [Acidobacteriota bacterium]